MTTIEDVSKAELYAQQKSWNYRSSDDQMILEICPINHCDNWHFYVRRGGEKDGLWDCKKCGENGNLYTLRDRLNDPDLSIRSMQDTVNKPDPLPDVIPCHDRLLADESGMEYLFERGITAAMIKQAMLGLMEQKGKKYLVIPYIEGNKYVNAKYRTLPPAEKAFFYPKGRETNLYNSDAITQGMDELILTEGELNVVVAKGNDMNNVVGVPGANNKKMTWITRIDVAAPKRIYTLYDDDVDNKDNVGQKAAENLAKRLALNTALPTPLNIKFPKFEKPDGTRGKDLNDWFLAGYTVAEFNALKAAAVPFEVRGVTNVGDALTLLEQSLEGKELLEPTYKSQYDSFNRKIGGFEPGDVIDITARAKIGKTTLALNIVDHLVAAYQEPGLIHCLEMPTARMVRKWVSMVTHTNDSPAMNDEEAKMRMAAMRAAIPVARDTILARGAGDLLFCDRQVRHPDEVYETWYQAVRRYGIKFGVFDNLQLLADKTLKNHAHRTTHISQISKSFKSIATELSLVLFRIVQPKKVGADQIVTHGDADGSSQIEKDCDGSVSLHRIAKNVLTADQFQQCGGVMDEEGSFDPHLMTNVGITRYAAGGVCVLYLDGATSTVRELTPLEFDNFKRPPSTSEMNRLVRDKEAVTLEA